MIPNKPPSEEEAYEAIVNKAREDSAHLKEQNDKFIAEHEKAQKESPLSPEDAQNAIAGQQKAYTEQLDAITENTKRELLALAAVTLGASVAAYQMRNFFQTEILAHPTDTARIQTAAIQQLEDLNKLLDSGKLRLIHNTNGKPAVLARSAEGQEQIYEFGTGNFHAEPYVSESKSPTIGQLTGMYVTEQKR